MVSETVMPDTQRLHGPPAFSIEAATDIPRIIRSTMIGALIDQHDDSAIHAAIHHHFSASGSYLRARMAFETSHALGLSKHDACVLASVCELLHNASLVHDDVLDHDTQRRGQPSVWHAYNEGVAICLGDLFISTAFGLCAQLKTHCERLPALLTLVNAKVRATIEGQAQAFSPALRETLEFSRFTDAAKGKSGPLFSLALEAPLMLAGHQHALDDARQATEAFAIAYQIFDDIDDYEQDMAIDELYASFNLIHALERGGITENASHVACEHALCLLNDAQQYAQRLPMASGNSLHHHAEALKQRFVHASS